MGVVSSGPGCPSANTPTTEPTQGTEEQSCVTSSIPVREHLGTAQSRDNVWPSQPCEAGTGKKGSFPLRDLCFLAWEGLQFHSRKHDLVPMVVPRVSFLLLDLNTNIFNIRGPKLYESPGL